MAKVIITFRIMPESIETNLNSIEKMANEAITAFGGEPGKTEIEPIAFGLNALKIFFILDEKRGSTEELEKKINSMEGVESCEVIDVRRAIG
jgi:translation elongation factor aEF-1 beta